MKKDQKVFEEDNATYKMLNMGNYVGYNTREWYESSPDFWTLMFMDKKKDGETETHMEALVDTNGRYIRFIIDCGPIKRVLQLVNGWVYNDVIVDFRQAKNEFFGDDYYALDGDIMSSDKCLLEDYLETTPVFTSYNKTFDGEIPSNDIIKQFLRKNIEYRNIIKEENGISR